MKVKVIKEFVDKHSKKLHKMGQVFECDNTRYKEILSAGKYVVPDEDPKRKEA